MLYYKAEIYEESESQMTVETVLQRVKELCKAYGASEVILYGSRAKGTALERSDIDIAVAGVREFDGLDFVYGGSS